MLKKDKEKVLDEVWTIDRVESFLELEPPKGVDADFHMLLRAYQSMRASDFELFLGMFTSAGRNLDAQNDDGATVRKIVSEHAHGAEFSAALQKAGAA